jgi:hypothetical protein
VRVACYTAVAGGYDDLLPHPEIDGVDFVAFADREVEPNGWEVRVRPPIPGQHPRMWAKVFKVFPHDFLPEHDASVWIDASHEILSPHFVDSALAAVDESGIALYTHPWRDCIYDEADASVVLQKYNGQPVLEQVAAYRAEGHPEHYGLWAAGTIARRHTPAVGVLMRAWWDEINRWTYQDQLSLPVVCRRHEITPASFPCHQVFGNQWTAIRAHNRED